MQTENLFGEVDYIVGTCADTYLVNPFSIIDTKDGNYKKNELKWMKVGIQSELGRDVKCNAEILKFKTSTSVFSPTLCEILYKWFVPKGGTILDPFAGGSVRGVVAKKLGLDYCGIELRKEQVDSNYEQARRIFANTEQVKVSDLNEITPIQTLGDYFFKRDDLFEVNGAVGGKARTALSLVLSALKENAKGFVTAGSRRSPQINILAKIGQHFGKPVRCHAPEGELGEELEMAKSSGAEIIQHKAGYNSVIIARARTDAEELEYVNIPFGMECEEAITQTRNQVVNLPPDINRIIVPCGSGMTLSGILWGLKDCHRDDVPVVAVRVGADPTERLDKYAPSDWRDMVTIYESGSDYHTAAPHTTLEGIELDPYYEAKCIPFIQPADLLWIVGIRPTLKKVSEPKLDMPNWIIGDSNEILDMIPDAEFDFVFSCPPYGDLEVYSDDPNDLSNMGLQDFNRVYRCIIQKSIDLLKRGGFACFVVGDYRDKDGYYVGFVWETVKAFIDAGAKLYNEIILVNNYGSAGIRANNCMKTKKVVKVHQNILVFKKP